MAQSIYDLVTDCAVRITAGNSQGSGFFVAPGLILTCAHVIEPAQQAGAPISIAWRGKSYQPDIYAYRDVAYPDLALLKVGILNHPCVLLAGSAEPFSNLYSYGYADKDPEGASTTFACEGWAGLQNEQLKFKDGQVRPGMSGSPVLNNETGSVCGIVQSSRDRASALGGKAMLTSVIFREFPGLEERQREFHTRDTSWSDALTQTQRQKLRLDWLPKPTVTGAAEVLFLYSGADEDKKWVGKLEKHLALMQKQGLITTWHTGKVSAISGGGDTAEEFNKHFEKASIILLMVSSDFMDDYRLESKDVDEALAKRKEGARVIPVILRACDWKTSSFGGLRPLPYSGKPIKQWSDEDEAFLEVTQGLRKVVEELKKPFSLLY